MPCLPSFQCGFLSIDGCLHHTTALDLFRSYLRLGGQQAQVILLDISDAFPSISHSFLVATFQHLGLNSRSVELLRDFLIGNTVRYLAAKGAVTESFTILRGVRQGDPVSPFLFNLGFDQILRRFLNLRGPYPLPLAGETQHLLAYADDVLLICPPGREVEDIRLFGELSSSVGLHLNMKKTRLISYRGSSLITRRSLMGSSLTPSTSVKYLGISYGWSEDVRLSFWRKLEDVVLELEQLGSSDLGPLCKLDAIQIFYVSQLTHRFRLEAIDFRDLAKIEGKLVQSYRTMFQLHASVSCYYLYGPRSRYCLGIPCLPVEFACQVILAFHRLLLDSRNASLYNHILCFGLVDPSLQDCMKVGLSATLSADSVIIAFSISLPRLPD